MGDPPGAATFHAPAEAYDRHIGRYGAELARALIDAAGVRPGERALDVGCGPGALTARARRACSAPSAWRRSTRRPPFAEACRAPRCPGVRVERRGGRGAAVRGRRVRPRARPARRELHGRPGGRRARDAAGDAARRHGGRRGLGLRRRDDAAAPLLGRGGRARPVRGRARRGPLHAVLHARGARRAVGGGRAGRRARLGGRRRCRLRRLRGPLAPARGGRRALGRLRGRAAARAPRRARERAGRRLGAGDAPFRLTARAWIATGRVP